MENNELSTNSASLGTDCISRRSAIDVIRAMQTYKLFAGDDILLIDQAGAQTELMLLTPIQPKRGRWESVPHKRARICSCCGHDEPYKFADDDAPIYNFCPNCGADMREVNHESN